MFVYYKGKGGKLHKIHAADTKDHIEAIELVKDHIKEQAWVNVGPILAVINGGEKTNG